MHYEKVIDIFHHHTSGQLQRRLSKRDYSHSSTVVTIGLDNVGALYNIDVGDHFDPWVVYLRTCLRPIVRLA